MQVSHIIIASILAFTSTTHPTGFDERQTETVPSPVLAVPEVHKRYTITLPTIPAIPAVPDVPAVPSPTPRAKNENNVHPNLATEDVSADPKLQKRQYTITVPTIPAIPAVPEVPAVPSPTPRAKDQNNVLQESATEEVSADPKLQKRQYTITIPTIPAIPAVPEVPAVPSPTPRVNAKEQDTIAFDTPVESEEPEEPEEPEELEETAESKIQRRQQTITVPAIPAIPAVPAVPAVPSPRPNHS